MSVALTINADTGAAITGDTSAFAAFKLGIYNGALRLCGAARLQSLSENQEARYLLDDVWNDRGVLMCLEKGLWNFARRSVQLDYDTTITPSFGYSCGFQKPGDWVRTMEVCADDRFNVPLTGYLDESGYLWSDVQTIYFAYVSSDPQFGGNVGLWPMSFVLAVEGWFAEQIADKLVGGSAQKVEMIRKEAKRRMDEARSKAAQNEATAMLPTGSWVRARRGRWAGLERGNPNSLYG